jgi:putative peptidoglycan lipid II flippase
MSKKLVGTTAIFSSMALVSRILAIIKDVVAAQLFGAGMAFDAFTIAFKIPNILRGILEGPFHQVFVPVFSEYRATFQHEEVRRLLSYITGLIGSVVLGITLLSMVGVKQWLYLAAPGIKDPSQFQLAEYFLRIVFSFFPLASITILNITIMNTYGLFWGSALVSIWPNLILISMALGFSHYFSVPVEIHAWGVLLAGLVQVGFTLPFLKQVGLLIKPRLIWRHPGVQKVMKLMGPPLLGASAGQIGIFINNVFLASFLPVGTFSWLHYAERLVYVPLTVFGFSLANAILPALSKEYVADNQKGFDRTLSWGIRSSLLMGLPSAIVLGLLSGPLIVSLFQYGKFTSFDVLQTQQIVLGAVLGVPAFMLAKPLSSAFYAQQDTLTPVKVLMWEVGINVLLGLILIPWLKHGGITLASSLSNWIQVGLLFFWLKCRIKNLSPEGGWKWWCASWMAANGALIVFLYNMTPCLDQWLAWTWFYRLFWLFLLGSIALLLYSIILRLTKLKIKKV